MQNLQPEPVSHKSKKSAIDYLKDRAAIIGPIATVGTFFAISIGSYVAYSNWQAAGTVQFYDRIMDSNRQVFNDQNRQVAVNVFRGLEAKNPQLIELRENIERSEGGFSKLYWATRALHLNHINVIAQAWILAGGSEKSFIRKFPGIDRLARAVSNHIRSEDPHDQNHPQSYKSLPEWYRKACSDLYPITNDFIYGEDFVAFINKIRHD